MQISVGYIKNTNNTNNQKDYLKQEINCQNMPDNFRFRQL